MPFIEKKFPQLAAAYYQRYKDRAFLPRTYGKRISQLMASLRQKYGIPHREPGKASAPDHGEAHHSFQPFLRSPPPPPSTPVIPRSKPERFACESFGAVEGPDVVSGTKCLVDPCRSTLNFVAPASRRLSGGHPARSRGQDAPEPAGRMPRYISLAASSGSLIGMLLRCCGEPGCFRRSPIRLRCRTYSFLLRLHSLCCSPDRWPWAWPGPSRPAHRSSEPAA